MSRDAMTFEELLLQQLTVIAENSKRHADLSEQQVNLYQRDLEFREQQHREAIEAQQEAFRMFAGGGRLPTGVAVPADQSSEAPPPRAVGDGPTRPPRRPRH